VHILSMRIVGGDHRLRNYSSIISLHPESIEGRPGTLVIESFVVDVPDGNTKDETCYFVQALIRCNLKSLADVSERRAVQDRTEPIDRIWKLGLGIWRRLGLPWMKLPRLSYLGVFGDRLAIVLVPSSIHTHAPTSCLLRFLPFKSIFGFPIFSRSTTTAFIWVLKLFMNEKSFWKKVGKKMVRVLLSVLQGCARQWYAFMVVYMRWKEMVFVYLVLCWSSGFWLHLMEFWREMDSDQDRVSCNCYLLVPYLSVFKCLSIIYVQKMVGGK